jgi:conjugal transfer/entry exclusion protein
MNAEATTHSHIEITETMVRLYVFLAQDLDRCLDLAARETYPEHELQSHLSSTRATLMEMLSVNQVVKGKVEQERHQVFSLVTACLTDGAAKSAALEELKTERAVLTNKIVALSDLLAVFRAA